MKQGRNDDNTCARRDTAFGLAAAAAFGDAPSLAGSRFCCSAAVVIPRVFPPLTMHPASGRCLLLPFPIASLNCCCNPLC